MEVLTNFFNGLTCLISYVVLLAICWWALKTMFGRK